MPLKWVFHWTTTVLNETVNSCSRGRSFKIGLHGFVRYTGAKIKKKFSKASQAPRKLRAWTKPLSYWFGSLHWQQPQNHSHIGLDRCIGRIHKTTLVLVWIAALAASTKSLSYWFGSLHWQQPQNHSHIGLDRCIGSIHKTTLVLVWIAALAASTKSRSNWFGSDVIPY